MENRAIVTSDALASASDLCVCYVIAGIARNGIQASVAIRKTFFASFGQVISIKSLVASLIAEVIVEVSVVLAARANRGTRAKNAVGITGITDSVEKVFSGNRTGGFAISRIENEGRVTGCAISGNDRTFFAGGAAFVAYFFG